MKPRICVCCGNALTHDRHPHPKYDHLCVDCATFFDQAVQEDLEWSMQRRASDAEKSFALRRAYLDDLGS